MALLQSLVFEVDANLKHICELYQRGPPRIACLKAFLLPVEALDAERIRVSLTADRRFKDMRPVLAIQT